MLTILLCPEDRKRFGLPDTPLSFKADSLADLDSQALIALEDYLDIPATALETELTKLADQRNAKVLNVITWLCGRALGANVGDLPTFSFKLMRAEFADDGTGDAVVPPPNRAARRARSTSTPTKRSGSVKNSQS